MKPVLENISFEDGGDKVKFRFHDGSEKSTKELSYEEAVGVDEMLAKIMKDL